jgi:hypothetical protein
VAASAASVWRSAWLAFALQTAAVSAQAQAEPSPAPSSSAPPPSPALEIDWHGPEDCERGDAVRAKVLRLLGQRALTAAIKVSVTVQHEKGSRYVAELATSTAAGGGSKRLEGESCDAIALASSVVIALSVDPNASLDAETPPEEPKPKPKPKPKRPPPPRPVVRRGPPRETFPYLHGSVGVIFDLLSDASAFTSAGIGVRHHRFSLELGGAVYQHRDVRRSDRSKVGAELSLVTGELLGCYALVPFQLGAVEVCPGLRIEYLDAHAFGVSNPEQGSVLLAAGVAALRGRLRATSWLSATLDGGFSARPFHPTFVLVGVGDVFEIPVFSPFARTGLVLEF